MHKIGAKLTDPVLGVDIHVVKRDNKPEQQIFQFIGNITSGVKSVLLEHESIAVLGSNVTATVPHIPIGGTFDKQPSNSGKVSESSSTVFAYNQRVARGMDSVTTCNDPEQANTSIILVTNGTVFVGG